MDYGKVFSRAWEITWENKFLWVLGFLIALGSGGGGSSSRSNLGGAPIEASQQMGNLMEQYGTLLIGLGGLTLLIGLALWVVRLVAEAGLISGVERIIQGNKLTFAEAFSSGRPFLSRMAVLSLLLYSPFIVAALIGGASFLSLGGTTALGGNASSPFSPGVLFPLLCLLGCVVVILGVLVNAVYPFAARSVVLGNLGAMDSIRYGWNLTRNHVGEVLIVWLIMIGIGLIFTIAAALVLLPLGFLAAGPALLSAVRGGTLGAAEVGPIVVGGLCIVVFGALISSVVQTYQSAVFTLTYRALIPKKRNRR